MKNSSDAIGNQTRGLPVCSAMPQQSLPPRAPYGEERLVMGTPVAV